MTITQWRSDARGFTLAELMVALVVISIVMAISFPMLAKVNRTQRLAGAAARIEAALMRARSTAVTRQTAVRVSFIAGNNTLQLEQDTDNDGDFDLMMRTVEIDDDIGFATISFDGAAVTFDQRGAPDNPGMIILANGGESSQRILVASGSGAVSVSSIASSAEESQGSGY